MKRVVSNLKSRFFLLLFCVSTSYAYGQVPTAKSLFEQMQQRIAAIKTLSYQLHYTHLDGGRNDSIFSASSTTWVEKASSDTIFGSHFHIRQNSKQGTSEYYYDGGTAVDIYHTHTSPEHQKSITIMKPFRMGSVNSIQTLMTVAFGYSKEVMSPDLDKTWVRYMDSMQVQNEGPSWVITWNETDPADDFTSVNKLYINKETHLLSRLYKRSMYRGIPIGKDVVITNLRVNDPSVRDSIRLIKSFPDYKVTYVDRSNYGGGRGEPVSLMKGTRVKEFTYTSLNGETVSLKAPKGKLLLLDFWETWCGACFVAMPKLVKLYEDYQEKGLEIIAVVTENKEQVKKIIASQKFPYPTVWGDKKLLDYFRLSARPRYILVDDAGRVVADTEGDLNQMADDIRRLLR